MRRLDLSSESMRTGDVGHVFDTHLHTRFHLSKCGQDVIESLFCRRIVPVTRRSHLIPAGVVLREAVVETTLLGTECDAVLSVSQSHRLSLRLRQPTFTSWYGSRVPTVLFL